MFFVDICLFISTVVFVLYVYFKWKFSYWYRKGVPYLKPKIPFGTLDSRSSSYFHSGVGFQNPYYQFKNQGLKHGGLYWFVKPMYMIVHPEYIKDVILKDFQYFPDRGMYYNKKDDPLSFHLFNIDGTDWNKIRTKLTPTFTSGKMKTMFKILENCGYQLKSAMNEYHNREPVDIKSILECYTTNVIGSCAFGLDCNTFEDPTNDFTKYCNKFVEGTIGFKIIRNFIAATYPKLAKMLKIYLVSPDVRQFFLDIVKDTINYRQKNNVTRNDFLNILMEIRQSKENKDGLTITEIAAQAFVFFIAGFETSSTTMAFCLFELACHADIQEKVRMEITEVIEHNGTISYEEIMKMNYLGQVVDETLRKYPPLPYLTRRCISDYKVPNSNIVVDKGTSVVIPTYALHHDPEFYPNPEQFNPDRFNLKNKGSIPTFAYLPFGAGPRNCIGFRFGLLQVKMGLVSLLRDFKFSLSDKTKPQLEFKKEGLFLRSINKILLDVEKVCSK